MRTITTGRTAVFYATAMSLAMTTAAVTPLANAYATQDTTPLIAALAVIALAMANVILMEHAVAIQEHSFRTGLAPHATWPSTTVSSCL